MTSKEPQTSQIYDVLIIGAGISGLNTAHHIQTKLPSLKYAILESRANIGGTWDFFKYPGLRSDTDLFTFGFGWSPWMENRSIASADAITSYLQRAIENEGIDKNIFFHHHVISADWSTKTQLWNLLIKSPNFSTPKTFATRFLILGTGYYDYESPLQPCIPGLSNFAGQVIHPQSWPAEFTYTNKKIVIIGSGATAITLLPNLAKTAKHVTMLQRSPTYILSIDNSAGTSWIHRFLPCSWSFKLSRWMFMYMTAVIFYLCRAFPVRARRWLEDGVSKQIPENVQMDPHFQPRYKPWDQRLCFSPDGDFFEALRGGRASVETGRIESVVGDGVVLEEGKRIEADVIVTATGLKLSIGGGIKIDVDGKLIELADRYAWRAALLEDVPNLAFMIGYVNASWTLGVEATGQLVCRILKQMKNGRYTSVVPRVPKGITLKPGLMWDLDATYVKQAAKSMPRVGDVGPWRGRTNYLLDLWRAKYGSIADGLVFYREGM